VKVAAHVREPRAIHREHRFAQRKLRAGHLKARQCDVTHKRHGVLERKVKGEVRRGALLELAQHARAQLVRVRAARRLHRELARHGKEPVQRVLLLQRLHRHGVLGVFRFFFCVV
jgi:hypothetical protein